MLTLIIYDDTGYMLSDMSGGTREPQGIPFLWVEIPDGKRIKRPDNGICVDVSVTPNVAILEDIPKTVEEVNTERVSAAEDAINMILTML